MLFFEIWFKYEYALLIASYGLVPEYNSSKIQKCFFLGYLTIQSNISLHLLASAWNKLSLEQLSGIFK